MTPDQDWSVGGRCVGKIMDGLAYLYDAADFALVQGSPFPGDAIRRELRFRRVPGYTGGFVFRGLPLKEKSEMQNHLSLLGWAVKDKVTGFTGTVSTIGFDLYGCVQAIVQPKAFLEKDTGAQKVEDARWFDVSRLEKVGDQPVMQPIPVKGDLTVAGADNSKPVR